MYFPRAQGDAALQAGVDADTQMGQSERGHVGAGSRHAELS